jgi:putative membrane protein
MKRAKKLLKADLERITAATAGAEARTSAEIVTVIANQSGSYTGQMLLVCLAAMTAYAVLFFVFLGFVQKLLALWLWHVRVGQLLLAFLAGQVLVFGVVFALLSFLPRFRSAVVSGKDKASRVRERAESAFFRHNITATGAGNGALIYVSLLEKRVELLVDAGIAARVKAGTWQEVVDGIVAGVGAGEFLPALERAIRRCGDILSDPFPRLRGDVNELPDRPVVE